MPPAFSWFLALRYLVTRWVNLIGIFGITIAIWAMIVVISIVSGIIGDTRKGIRGASPDLLATQLKERADYFEIEPVLRAIDGVGAISPRLSHDVMLHPKGLGMRWKPRTNSTGGSNSALSNNYVLLVGIDAAAENETTGFSDWLREKREQNDPNRWPGRPFVESFEQPFLVSPARIRAARELEHLPPQAPLLSSQPGFVMSVSRAKHGDEIKPGQPVDIVSARFKNAAGGALLEMKKTLYFAGTYETEHRFLDMSVCYCDIGVMREMMGGDAFMGPALVTEVAIKLADGASPATVSEAIEAALAEMGGGKVLDWEAQNETYLRAVDRERLLLKVVLFAVLVVAGFLIFATLHMMVAQKIKDIGILASMGASPSGIGAVFVFSGFAVGVVGCVVGLTTGYMTAYFFNDICAKLNIRIFPPDLYAIDKVPIDLELSWMIQVAAIALALALLVSWLPARKASRADPVKALIRD